MSPDGPGAIPAQNGGRERFDLGVEEILGGDPWPVGEHELIDLQHRLAELNERALAAARWSLPDSGQPAVGGCFVAFRRGEAGPGRPGDRAWAAAVVWRPEASPLPRGVDRHVRGRPSPGSPRVADDVLDQAVASARVPAAYLPGLLALREGPVLAAAVNALAVRPDVLLVDASGTDHPRRAGLAVHLGAVTGLPTVGVTQRPLVGSGSPPEPRRGAMTPVVTGGRRSGYWVCTRTGARPVVAHAGWRTTPQTAARAVLAASTPAARTPVPLQEARRAAREVRALAGAG